MTSTSLDLALQEASAVLQQCKRRRLQHCNAHHRFGAGDAAAGISAKQVQNNCTEAIAKLEKISSHIGQNGHWQHFQLLLQTRAELYLQRAHLHVELRGWARALKDCHEARVATLAASGGAAGGEKIDDGQLVADREGKGHLEQLATSWSESLPLLLDVSGLELCCTSKLRQYKAFAASVRTALAYLGHLQLHDVQSGVGALALLVLPEQLVHFLAERAPFAKESAKHVLDFLLAAGKELQDPARIGRAPWRPAAFLAAGGPRAFALLTDLAADARHECQTRSLQCLLDALRVDEGPFAAKPEMICTVAPFCLQFRDNFDERCQLCLQLLVDLAARPAVAARVKLSQEMFLTLLNVLMREEAVGAPALSVVLLLRRWSTEDQREAHWPELLRSANCVCHMLQVLTAKSSDCGSTSAKMQALAFLHLRPLLSQPVEVQDEPPSRGTRLSPLFGTGAVVKGQAEDPSCAVTAACALRRAFVVLTSAGPSAVWRGPCAISVTNATLPKPLDGAVWAEGVCDAATVKSLLLSWLLDYCQPDRSRSAVCASVATDASLIEMLLGEGSADTSAPAIPTLLLNFVEAEIGVVAAEAPPIGVLHCLRCLAQHPAIRGEMLHRTALFEQLVTYCDGGKPTTSTVVAASRDRYGQIRCASLLPSERADACATLASLLSDPVDGQRWALRMMPIHGPSRILRWAACHSVNPAAAYKLLRCVVKQGGRACARDVWRLLPVDLVQPAALRAALCTGDRANVDDEVAPNSPALEAAQAAREQWCAVCAAVLAGAVCGQAEKGARIDPRLWGASADPLAIVAVLDEVLSTDGRSLPDDVAADLHRACAALRRAADDVAIDADKQSAVAGGSRAPTPFDCAAAAAHTAAANTSKWLRPRVGTGGGANHWLSVDAAVEEFIPGGNRALRMQPGGPKCRSVGDGTKRDPHFLAFPVSASAVPKGAMSSKKAGGLSAAMMSELNEGSTACY